jgi:NitT/TauT family transport system ATP-binding protein
MQQLLVEVLGATRATVVFVTHDVDEALFLGDRLALLGGDSDGGLRLYDVPRPREHTANDDPATTALRHDILASLGS